MKFDYSNREEWEEIHKAQLLKAITQAAAVAIAIILCALLPLLTGCSSSKNIASVATEKATTTNKDAAKADTLIRTTAKADTLYIHDSIATATAVHNDTVFIQKERYRTLYRTKLHTDTLYRTRTDTIRTERTDTITVTKTVLCQRRHVSWRSALLALIIALTAAAIGAWAAWKRKKQG